jgi:hypothetical protein
VRGAKSHAGPMWKYSISRAPRILSGAIFTSIKYTRHQALVSITDPILVLWSLEGLLIGRGVSLLEQPLRLNTVDSTGINLDDASRSSPGGGVVFPIYRCRNLQRFSRFQENSAKLQYLYGLRLTRSTAIRVQ